MPDDELFIIHTPEDLINPVNDLLAHLPQVLTKKAAVVFLSGNLGYGKTAFVKAFAERVGIESRIQSPTFTLMKSYSVNTSLIPELYKMIHIDAYRLEPPHKQVLNVEELSHEPGTIIFIEWPEQVDLDISMADVRIVFDIMSEEIRKIQIHYT